MNIYEILKLVNETHTKKYLSHSCNLTKKEKRNLLTPTAGDYPIVKRIFETLYHDLVRRVSTVNDTQFMKDSLSYEEKEQILDDLSFQQILFTNSLNAFMDAYQKYEESLDEEKVKKAGRLDLL